MTEPLFRHKGRAEQPSRADEESASAMAVDDDIAVVGRGRLTGQYRKQFVLPVAGNTRDAENLAAPYFKRNVFQIHAVWIVGRQRQVLHDKPRVLHRMRR